jgi:hypothetical protein
MEWRLAHGGEGPVGAKRELIASETKEELGSMAVDAYASKEQMLQELGGLLEAAAEDARGGRGGGGWGGGGAAEGGAAPEQRVVQLKLSVLNYHAAVYVAKQVAEEQGDEQAKMLAQQSRRRPRE